MQALRDHAFQPLLQVARADFYAGRYRSCIATLFSVVSCADPLRDAAAIVSAHAHLRLREPLKAVELLARIVTDSDHDDEDCDELAIEARGVFAYALALSGDHRTAAQMLPPPEATTAPALRSELMHVAALLRWLTGDRAAIEALLARDNFDGAIARARRASLRAWLQYDAGDMIGFARLMDSAATTMLESEESDLGIAAAALRGLAAVACELDPATGTFERASQIYRAIDWTDGLAPDRFQVQLHLAWGHAHRGNTLGALSLANEAVRSAPSETWRVAALVERSALRVGFGEPASAAIDLRAALDAAHGAPWSEANDEEQLGLLALAEQLAPLDRSDAYVMLARFCRLAGDASVRYQQTGGSWLWGLRTESFGVVQGALGQRGVAINEISRALEIWERLGFRWRASRAALRLYEIEPSAARLALAEERIAAYPRSWLAAEIHEIRDRPAVGTVERLTPRQREVFHALAEGLNVRAIAERLKLSVNTVRVHRAAVYIAFDVSSQIELAALARSQRVI